MARKKGLIYPDDFPDSHKILELHDRVQKLEKKRSEAKIREFQKGASFPLPDIYDSDDPKLIGAALEVIINLRQNYISGLDYSGLHYFGKQVDAAIAVAFDIRSAWSYKGLILPDVPLVKNSKGGVLILEQWFRNAMTLVLTEIASAGKRKNSGQTNSGKVGETKQKKRRKKTPPQLLKETRERHAAQELTKNPNITAEKLGKMLECDKSTIVRLKAWQNRRTLAYSPPPNGFKKQDDEGRTDTEAIGENESNNEIENL